MDFEPKLTIGVSILNQLHKTRDNWLALIRNTVNSRLYELAVIDHGSTDGSEEWLRTWIFPHFGKATYIRLSEQCVLGKAYNTLARATSGPYIAFLHNDLAINEKGWDLCVLGWLNAINNIGVIGFGGGRGVGADGVRQSFWSNMCNAEVHGGRYAGVLPVATLDGFSLICNRKLLKQLGGFDETTIFHYYDLDISMGSIVMGWRNIMIGIPVTHHGGFTFAGGDYRKWLDKHLKVYSGKGFETSQQLAHNTFLSKWNTILPISIKDDLNINDHWSFTNFRTLS